MPQSSLSEQMEQSWHANAAAWSAAVRSGAIESRRLATDHAILQAVRRESPRRVLDLGCGEGWLVQALLQHTSEVVGVDGSAALIDAAIARNLDNDSTAADRGTVGTVGNSARFHVLRYAELVANPGQVGTAFDVVVANFALLEQQTQPLLKALHTVMRPGAALIIQTLHPWNAAPPYEDGWRTEDFRGFSDAQWQQWLPMPWYFRTLGSWVALLRDSGYLLESMAEPRHPDTHQPLSLLMTARR